jgi:hypothetical protein
VVMSEGFVMSESVGALHVGSRLWAFRGGR